MDALRISGGRRLSGRIPIGGAKNAALPILCATLLSDGESLLRNVPALRDIETTAALLGFLGRDVQTAPPEVRVHAVTRDIRPEAPYELVRQMRASVLVLGPLLARYGRAKVSLPGGCAIGTRPIDLHLSGFEKLGAEVRLEAGNVVARAPSDGRLRAADVEFNKVTVTGTENLMMAATLARGTTTLRNCALEPEIVDLAELLNKMGARVNGAGTDTIQIEGVASLGGAEHTIIPDRIETGTFIVAAAITNGQLEIKDCRPDHLQAVIAKLREVGVVVQEVNPTTLEVTCCPEGLSAGNVSTAPHPSFPTDMQAQYMVLMTQARGRSEIVETVVENRFMHASELQRMGAQIHIDGRSAIVDGVTPLAGARVIASDLRASA